MIRGIEIQRRDDCGEAATGANYAASVANGDANRYQIGVGPRQSMKSEAMRRRNTG